MKRVKALLSVLVVVAGVYVAWKLIPPWFNNYQLQDDVDNEARLDTYNANKPEADIKASVVKLAQGYGIMLNPEDVLVSRDGAILTISFSYTVHVDLPGYPFDWKMHIGSKDKRI